MTEIERPRVVILREHTINDIPAAVRAAADEIEAGKIGSVECGVGVFLVDGRPEVFMWGPRVDNSLLAIGLLQAAIHRLAAEVAGE